MAAQVSIDPLHAVHSLCHNMADRCDLAGVHPTDKAAILGHLNTGASEKHYGLDAVKRVRLKRAMEKAIGMDLTPGETCGLRLRNSPRQSLPQRSTNAILTVLFRYA
ncbi:hypothetical protein A6U98_07760 [Rhizobium sp. WYCCWR10014]|nr:hypothetical protein A6U98_07760 [Rhizobium sp. WYCCWR10014]